jgi:putative colanic acid biosynthesis glycosyltransferase WcaI
MAGKAVLTWRGASEMLSALRTFLLGVAAPPGEVVLTVAAPFMPSYAVVAAARVRRAHSALITHDLFPDVLVVAGLLKPGSFVTRIIRAANSPMFRALNAAITIGRDAERLFLSYSGMTRNKIRLIPNWATLSPWPRPLASDNPLRKALRALHWRPVWESRLHS